MWNICVRAELHRGIWLVNLKERDHCQLKWPCASTFSDYDNRIPSNCLTKLRGPVARKCAFLSGRFQFQSQGLALLIEAHCVLSSVCGQMLGSTAC